MSALEQHSYVEEDADELLRRRLDELEADFNLTSDHMAELTVEMTRVRMELRRLGPRIVE